MKHKGPAVAALAVVLTLCLPLWPRPVVETADGSRLLILPQGTFSVCYTHSVNLGPVEDDYQMGDGKLVLVATRFTDYGAGMPEPDWAAGETFTDTGTWLEIGHMHRELARLALWTGVTADHRIICQSRNYPLNDRVPPQTQVIIIPRRVSLLALLLQGKG